MRRDEARRLERPPDRARPVNSVDFIYYVYRL